MLETSGNWLDWARPSITTTAGSDTYETTFVISNAEELAWIVRFTSENSASMHNIEFVIDNNINLFGHNFTPIGSTSAPFRGRLTANDGASINNMAILDSNAIAALVAVSETDATAIAYHEALADEVELLEQFVNTFGFEADLTNNNHRQMYLSLFAPGVANITLNNVYIVNNANSNITVGSDNFASITAGAVGVSNAFVFNVNTSGYIEASNNNTSLTSLLGGVVGISNRAVINTTNNAILASRANALVGGVVATTNNSVLVGNANYSKQYLQNVLGAGGIAADITNTNIMLSYSSANVEADAITAFFGGLVGSAENSGITNSYAIVNLDYNANNIIGGVVGVLTNSTLENTYASLTLSQVSGIVGGVVGSTDSASTIINNYFISNQLGDANGIGRYNGNTTVPTSVYDGVANRRTFAELRNVTTFVDWNFFTIWAIDYTTNPLNGGLPVLFYHNNHQRVDITQEGVPTFGNVFVAYNPTETATQRLNANNVNLVFVLTGNTLTIMAVESANGSLYQVIVDGSERTGADRGTITFANANANHDVIIRFIQGLFRLNILGLITAESGFTVPVGTTIIGLLTNTDTGRSFVITLVHNQTREFKNLNAGNYVVTISTVMNFTTSITNTVNADVAGPRFAFALDQAWDGETITVNLNMTSEDFISDSAHNRDSSIVGLWISIMSAIFTNVNNGNNWFTHTLAITLLFCLIIILISLIRFLYHKKKNYKA